VTSRHFVAMARNADGGQEVIFYLGSTITMNRHTIKNERADGYRTHTMNDFFYF